MKRTTSDSEELATKLSEEWIGVAYDVKREWGRVRVPNVGYVEFRESQNERAVRIHIPAFNVKCSAREAKKLLVALSKLIGSV